MTKKELKQEAKEWLNKWELCNKCDHKVQCIEDNAMCPQVVERAYLASAEPRERQITGLSKHILELQKDKGNLTDRVRELEQQNNWLEGCKSELGEHLGKANDRIAVLEKRCANYEMTISKMEKGTCDICKETEKDKKIEELEAQIEKLIDFVLSKTECCDICPITDTCINSEGTCPYAGILSKGEEAVTREWLMQKIAKEIKEK